MAIYKILIKSGWEAKEEDSSSSSYGTATVNFSLRHSFILLKKQSTISAYNIPTIYGCNHLYNVVSFHLCRLLKNRTTACSLYRITQYVRNIKKPSSQVLSALYLFAEAQEIRYIPYKHTHTYIFLNLLLCLKFLNK